MTIKYPHHWLPITLETKRDLALWQDFLRNWPGSSFILETDWTPSSDIQLSLMPLAQMDAGLGIIYSIDGP